MEIIVFLSIGIAVLAVLTSIFLVRRVKKQIAEMTDALVDVKNGNGNRRILSATNELIAPLAYEINEIVVSYESRLSIVRQAEETNRQLCAQLRVCSQAGGIPVYPRFSQPDNSESWDDAGNGI